MLRSIRLKNFVQFTDEVELQFGERGVHYLVGENGAGKSSVFEAIRNCLKTTDVIRQSTKRIDRDVTIAVCEFEFQTNKVLSVYVVEPKGRTLKFLIIIEKNAKKKWYYKLYAAIQESNSIDWNRLRGEDLEKITKFRLLLPSLFERPLGSSEPSLLELITTLTDLEKMDLLTADTEDTFNGFIDQNISIQMTLSHRGINPSQSLHGGADRFVQSSENADVLKSFLNHDDVNSDDRKKAELEILRHITNGIHYGVRKSDNNELFLTFHEKEAPLLRLSESVIEAKIVSILLSQTQSRIVCLEEPHKGMDVQTKLRLRDKVLKEVNETQSKQVIINTHDCSFITPWSLAKCHFFREINNTLVIVDGKDLANLDQKEQRYITGHPINMLFVSKRIFLVEGESDLLFIEALKSVLLKDQEITKALLSRYSKIEKVELDSQCFQTFLTSLTTIIMGSEGNKTKVEKVCRALSMDKAHDRPATRFYLLDKDTHEHIRKSLQLTDFDVNPDFADLAAAGIFIWNTDLEIGVLKFCEQYDLVDVLNQNKTPTVPVRKDMRVQGGANYQLRRRKTGRQRAKGKLFLEDPCITETNMYTIVSEILSKVDFRPESPDNGGFGTVPKLIKFLVKKMINANIGQGD